MAVDNRLTSGQKVTGGLAASQTRRELALGASLSPALAHVEDKPEGYGNALGQSLLTEESKGNVTSSVIRLGAVLFALHGSLGLERVEEGIGVGGQDGNQTLNRYTFIKYTNKPQTPDVLTIRKGTEDFGERVRACVVTDFGLSISQNGGNTGLTATLLGKGLSLGDAIAFDTTMTVTLLGVTDPAASVSVRERVGAEPADDDPEAAQLVVTSTAADLAAALNQYAGTTTIAAVGTNTFEEGPLVVTLAGIPAGTSFYTRPGAGISFSTVTIDAAESQAGRISDAQVTAPGLTVAFASVLPDEEAPLANIDAGYSRSSFDVSLSGLYQSWFEQDGLGATGDSFTPGENTMTASVWLNSGPKGIGMVDKARRNEKFYLIGHQRLATGEALTILIRVTPDTVDDFGDNKGKYGFIQNFKPIDEPLWGGCAKFIVTSTEDFR